MQVLKCTDEIGWDQGRRRRIVFSTDTIFHYAEDGKFAGNVALIIAMSS